MRIKWIIGLLVLVAAVVTALLMQSQSNVEQADREKDKAEFDAGLASARVISEQFEKVADLRVAELRGTVVSRARYEGTIFNSIQMTKAPFTVGYFVDLRRLPVSAYRWDDDTKTMRVRIPSITIDRPNIDMTKAEVKQEGVWISAEAGRELQKQAAVRLQIAAVDASRKPEYLQQARASARSSLEALVRAPLAAARLTNVKVDVFFPEEEKSERWDVSTPLAEVLAGQR